MYSRPPLGAQPSPKIDEWAGYDLLRALRLNRLLQIIAIAGPVVFGLGYVIPFVGWLFHIIGVLCWCWLGLWMVRARLMIDHRLWMIIGPTSTWSVHMKFYPSYKHVDIFRAAEAFARTHPGMVLLQSEHGLMLSQIIRSGGEARGMVMDPPTMASHKVGPGESAFFPSDSFWVLPATPTQSATILRVQFVRMHRRVLLEVASANRDTAEEIVNQLAEIASQNSIYRNQTIRVVFGPEAPESYGDDDDRDPMDVAFVQDRLVTEEDIVHDEQIRGVLERTVVDFHERRDQLAALGLPQRRGVLFYGPPGTGKTHTCRYLIHRLKPITTVVVTGNALLHMKTVCSIARAFQPALVLLEDVDLVFSERQTNFHTTILGEFLDQLDGFAPADQIIFILTTNALERVEAAIKDRPGRVSQVMYFGRPNAELRRRYLDALLRQYDISDLHIDKVVQQTDGVSQAFLKELIIRTVQIASRNLPPDPASVPITNLHIETALNDMISGGGKAGKRIIGFQIEN